MKTAGAGPAVGQEPTGAAKSALVVLVALRAGAGMLLRGAAAGAAIAAAVAAIAGVVAAAITARLLVAVILVAHRAGAACFFRIELVGIARSVGGAAAFGSDFTLALRVHASETLVALIAVLL